MLSLSLSLLSVFHIHKLWHNFDSFLLRGGMFRFISSL